MDKLVINFIDKLTSSIHYHVIQALRNN